MDLLLSPPLAFLLYIPLVLAVAGLGRLQAGPGHANPIKASAYGSGEAPPAHSAAPGYQPFFFVAFFFAVLHLCMLVLGIGSLPPAAALYIVGLIVALVALILG